MVHSHTLHWFLVLAEERNIDRAALRCGVTGKVLARHLAGLEAEYGAKLCWNDGKRVSLTKAGYGLKQELLSLEPAEIPVDRIELMRDRLLDSTIPKWIVDTAVQLWPRTFCRISVGGLEQQIGALKSESIDIALTYGTPNSRDPEMAHEFLFYQSMAVLLPSHHRLAHSPTLGLEQLSREIWLSRSPTYTEWDSKLLFAECAKSRFRPKVRVIHKKMPIAPLIAAGEGIAFVPLNLGSQCPSGTVSIALCPRIPVALGMVFRCNESSMEVSRFLELVRRLRTLEQSEHRDRKIERRHVKTGCYSIGMKAYKSMLDVPRSIKQRMVVG